MNKFIYGVRVPLTEKRLLKWRDIRRGDVVVFEAPRNAILSPDERERGVRKDFIKRAIGIPGDVIEIKNERVFVNGKPWDNPHAVFNGSLPLGLDIANCGPVKVPPDCCFVLGDNRRLSKDSRMTGPIPISDVYGNALMILVLRSYVPESG